MPGARHSVDVAEVQCVQKNDCRIGPWRSGCCDRALHSARISIAQGSGDAEYFSSFHHGPPLHTYGPGDNLDGKPLSVDRSAAHREDGS